QKATNTLVCLLQGLTGHVAKIELRNEASLVGKIMHVDGFMDVDMSNVSYTDIENKTTRFDDFHIQGKNIRFVQVPDELDMLTVITQQ
ncbi:U7 snRNA-associated Sm-like protein LSm10, partial [Lamellibrachia satsuma]